jgi:hypothetical protein
MTDTVPDDDALLSRSAEANPDGKLTVRVDFMSTPTMAQDIATVATMRGISQSEYLRGLVERDMYGTLETMRKRLRQLS